MAYDIDDFKTFEAECNKEIEYAKENDYVFYFDILVENISYDDDVTYEEGLVKLYDEHWEKVKECIRRDYLTTNDAGEVIKPKLENLHNLEGNVELLLCNDLQDLEMALHNCKRYDDRTSFAEDCLELFDMEEDGKQLSLTFMNFTLAVGEGLNDSGKIAESDAYYENILAEYPGCGYMIANYIMVLDERGEHDKAKELLEAHINLEMEPVEENEMLYERAWEIYSAEGNDELARQYCERQKQIIRSYRTVNVDNAKIAPSWMSNEPIVKPAKIYPNDPCPCGSGKKYKKCCGKK